MRLAFGLRVVPLVAVGAGAVIVPFWDGSGTYVLHEGDRPDGLRIVWALMGGVSLSPTIRAADRLRLFALLELDGDGSDDTVGHASRAEKVIQLVTILRLMVESDGRGRVTARADMDVWGAMRSGLQQKRCKQLVVAIQFLITDVLARRN